MTSALLGCLLVASTTAHKQIISTDTLRISGLHQAARVYMCPAKHPTLPKQKRLIIAERESGARMFVPAAVPLMARNP